MLSFTNTKTYYYKVLMLLNRLKFRGGNALFREQIVKVLQYAYWTDYPFPLCIEGAINYYLLNKKIKKLSKSNNRNRHHSYVQKERSFFVPFNYEEWKVLFPHQQKKMTKKLIKSIAEKEEVFMVELYVNKIIYERQRKTTWNVYGRLCGDFVMKYIPNRSRFNSNAIEDGLKVLKFCYKNKLTQFIKSPAKVKKVYFED